MPAIAVNPRFYGIKTRKYSSLGVTIQKKTPTDVAGRVEARENVERTDFVDFGVGGICSAESHAVQS